MRNVAKRSSPLIMKSSVAIITLLVIMAASAAAMKRKKARTDLDSSDEEDPDSDIARARAMIQKLDDLEPILETRYNDPGSEFLLAALNQCLAEPAASDQSLEAIPDPQPLPTDQPGSSSSDPPAFIALEPTETIPSVHDGALPEVLPKRNTIRWTRVPSQPASTGGDIPPFWCGQVRSYSYQAGGGDPGYEISKIFAPQSNDLYRISLRYPKPSNLPPQLLDFTKPIGEQGGYAVDPPMPLSAIARAIMLSFVVRNSWYNAGRADRAGRVVSRWGSWPNRWVRPIESYIAWAAKRFWKSADGVWQEGFRMVDSSLPIERVIPPYGTAYLIPIVNLIYRWKWSIEHATRIRYHEEISEADLPAARVIPTAERSAESEEDLEGADAAALDTQASIADRARQTDDFGEDHNTASAEAAAAAAAASIPVPDEDDADLEEPMEDIADDAADQQPAMQTSDSRASAPQGPSIKAPASQAWRSY